MLFRSIDHIVGAGGQQFFFGNLVDRQEMSFQQFYTSNVSWKRGLTADWEQIFSESFRDAAFEDVELGFRLSRRGLRLRYLADAVGLHLHPMTARTFFERMRRVGRMRTVLAAMHPGLMTQEDADFFQDLEVERRRRAAGHARPPDSSPDGTLEAVVKVFEELDDWAGSPRSLTGAAACQMAALERRAGMLRQGLFDELCDAFMRLGQAEEWARGSADAAWVAGWVAMLRMARLGARPPVSAPAGTLAPPSSPPPTGQSPSPKRAGRLKQWFLRYEWARAVQSWLRESKRRRRG